MSLAEIHAAIPHRDPFLLVDEIVRREAARIVCRKRFTGSEAFYAGHYPGRPITPGVLLCEAAIQAGAILLAEPTRAAGATGSVPVVTRISDVRFKQIVNPGDTIELDVELTERLANAYFLKAKILRDAQLVARLEFACTLAPVS